MSSRRFMSIVRSSAILAMLFGMQTLFWDSTFAQPGNTEPDVMEARRATNSANNLAKVADLAARVELLTTQLREAQMAQRVAEEKDWERLLLLGGGIFTLFTLLTGIAGWFVNNRMKDPEEWRENLRKQLLAELSQTRQQVTEKTTSVIEEMDRRFQGVQEEHTKKTRALYDKARQEALQFETQNTETLNRLRELTNIGEPIPGRKPDPETLYWLAEQARSEPGPEGRAKGIGYLRRLTEDDIEALPPVLHNSAVLAKQYNTQELALRLFRKAWEASGKSRRYATSYAHELASAHSESESLAIFHELLDQYPNDDHVFHLYIDALRELDLYSELDLLLQKRGDTFLSSAKVLREWADILMRTGRYQEAQEKIGKAVRIDPSDDLGWGYQTRIAFAVNNMSLARSAVNEALRVAGETSPRVPGHLVLLGNIERAEGNTKEAFEAYGASIVMSTAPTQTMAWIQILGSQLGLGVSTDAGGDGADESK